MRVGLYVPSWPPGSVANGIVTYAAQMVPALRALGHEVFVLTHQLNGQADNYTIDLREYVGSQPVWRRVLAKMDPDLANFNTAAESLVSAIRHLVFEQKIEVLEIEESFGWSYSISRSTLLPVVVRLHGPWFMNGRFNSLKNTRKDIQREKAEGKGIKEADYVTAPSLDVLRSVRSYYRLDLHTSEVIPNPIDAVGEFEKWKLEDCDKDSLLFVGRFDEIKGGDLVLRAFAELAQLYPRLKLTFVGPDIGVGGASSSPVKFEEYARKVLSKDALCRLFFKGKLDSHQIKPLRPRHFATVCAAQMEIFPYSVLEAMSHGCPVVVSAVGGVPEMVQCGRNGLTFQSQDLNGMISACRTLLDNHQEAIRLGDQARRDCLNRKRVGHPT